MTGDGIVECKDVSHGDPADVKITCTEIIYNCAPFNFGNGITGHSTSGDACSDGIVLNDKTIHCVMWST
eukprot:UN26894